jgi:hypothetical protein
MAEIYFLLRLELCFLIEKGITRKSKMKANWLAVVALMFAFSAAAQDGVMQTQQPWGAHVHSYTTLVAVVGGGSSTMLISGTETERDTVSSITGFSGGVLAELGGGFLSLQSGALYMREGSLVTISTDDTNLELRKGEITIDYLGIPLLAKFNIMGEDSRRLTFKIGVVPAFLMSKASSVSKTSKDTDGKTTESNSMYTSTEGLRETNLIAQAGFGVEVPMRFFGSRSNDFRIEALYNRALLSLNQNSNSGQIYTQSVLMTIGMGFGL